jgi:NADPH:quinone reductase-like Zn-dependent oxidoreductase
MKAIKCIKYGSPNVLKIVNIEKPKLKDNQILVKNYATSVTIADCRVRGFVVPSSFWLPARLALGFSKPRQSILGGELSGKIEGIGKNIKKYNVGDEIFAFTGHKLGSYAEYIILSENDCIAIKPKNLTFGQSAVLSFGGITALHFLEKAKLQKNEKILIYGASGSVGTYAIQLAKYFGAFVTGICGTNNLNMIKEIGADSVLDYTKTDLSDINEKYDIVFDAVGKGDITKSIALIRPNGRYIHLVTDPLTELRIRRKLKNTMVKLIGGTYNANLKQIEYIRKMAVENIIKPVIDKYFNFNEIVSAHEYVDKGHKKGNVVIKIIDA